MRKQKIVIYGNCITNPIYRILQTNYEFSQKYNIELLKHCFLCTKEDVKNIHEKVETCDILITQSIGGQKYLELGLDTKTLQKHLSLNARSIVIPTPYFSAYNPEQYYLHKEDGSLVGCCEGLSHPYHNKIITWGYINGINPQKLYEILDSDICINIIKNNVKENIKELKRREEYTDFKISDFIEKHYLNKRLFWTQNHPTNYLLEFMSREILRILNLRGNVTLEKNFFDEIKTPILNSVKKELNLKFNDNNRYQISDIYCFYKYYNNNYYLVELNKKECMDFCKGVDLNKIIKKYLLLGFFPIYKSVKADNEVKKYILGIPYSSCQNNGDYTVKRTFFQMFKKKKSYMYSKYYFLGIQIWCKKKSKINILQDNISELYSKVQTLKEENRSLKSEFNKNIQDLKEENRSLRLGLQENIKNLQRTNYNLIYTLKDELEICNFKRKHQHIANLYKKENDVNICMIADENYVLPTLVAIYSAIYNKNYNSKYNFYLILNNVSEDSLAKFKQLEKDDIKINIINADISKYNNIIVHTHVSPTGCLKFDLANILTLDKILYLDGDILVRDDLSELYSKDISNFYLAAVRDMGGELSQHFNSIIGVDKYFNSGIMLLNLKKIREEHLSDQFVKIKLANPQWMCMDQDTLNYIMSKNTLWLDVKYNCMLPLYNNPFYGYSIENLNDFYQTEYVNKFEMEYDAVIIHFAGESKTRPWKCKNGTYKKIWNFFYELFTSRKQDYKYKI